MVSSLCVPKYQIGTLRIMADWVKLFDNWKALILHSDYSYLELPSPSTKKSSCADHNSSGPKLLYTLIGRGAINAVYKWSPAIGSSCILYTNDHVNTIWSAKHLTTFWPPGTSTEVLCFHGGARRWITAFQQLQSDRESCLERSKSFNCRWRVGRFRERRQQLTQGTTNIT